MRDYQRSVFEQMFVDALLTWHALAAAASRSSTNWPSTVKMFSKITC